MSEAIASQPSPIERKHSGLFVDDDSPRIADQLSQAETLRGFICDQAQDVMSKDGWYDVKRVDGVLYKVSKGHEHFRDITEKIDDAYSSGAPEVYGCKLMQRVGKKKDQEFIPILLVQHGLTEEPIAEIRPKSGGVTKGTSLEVTDDEDYLNECLMITSAIYKDTDEKAKAEKAKHGHWIRRGIGAAALAITVGVASIVGIPRAREAYDNHQQDRQEQADQLTRLRAQEALVNQKKAEIERQNAAKALEERNVKVRSFDSTYDVESSSITRAGAVGVAQASDQFVDIGVPEYGQQNISRKLARDISEPRRIEIKTNKNGCQVTPIQIDAESSFRVIHDGTSGRTYNFSFDPKADRFVLCEAKNMPQNAQSAPATNIVIQEVPAQG